MFPNRYFPLRFFPLRYWPGAGKGAVIIAAIKDFIVTYRRHRR